MFNRLRHEIGTLGVWPRLLRNGAHPCSVLRLRLGDYDDIRFRGRLVGGPDRARLAWMARHIWAGEYDLPGFIPSPGDRVLDVGANVGVFSLLAASRGASVTAIEPHAETFSWLERNTGGWLVECRHAAVVGRVPSSGDIEFVEGPTSTSHHIASLAGSPPERSVTRVPAVSFTALMRDGYDLIKLDVEGAEFEIVRNTELDDLRRITRLVAEVHERAGNRGVLRNRLEQAGLVVRMIDCEYPAHSLLVARRTNACDAA